MTVELFDVRDAERLSEAFALRFAVFVEEQGVPREVEIDGYDRDGSHAVHALVRDEAGCALGTGRLYAETASIARIGRMAVVRSARGRGVGGVLLAALVAEAAACGYAEVRLDAQAHAIGFYERGGFEVCGEPFDEVGIPHRPMRRLLAEPEPAP